MTFADIPHNGYTNYETWLVKSSIDNTESLYNMCKAIYLTNPENAQINLYKAISDLIEKMKPSTSNDIWQCLINSVIKDRINFSEIAQTLIADFSTN